MCQKIIQLLSHVDDAISHTLHLTFPLSIKSTIAQYGVCNSGTVNWRAKRIELVSLYFVHSLGVHRPNNDLELRINTSFLFKIACNKGKRSDTLSIEAHVLGERLCQCDLVSFRDEMAHRKSITRSRARRETLVGHVKEWKELLVIDDLGYFTPLVLCRVDSSRIMCASV